MNERTFDILIDRLRNSCLFYIKGDVLVLAAWTTLYATFRFDSPYSTISLSTFQFQFLCASLALFAGILFESVLTTTHASEDAADNMKRAARLKRFYFAYIAAQVLALGFVAGSVVVYLFMKSGAAG
jgi:hypothetical protein